MEAKSPRGEVPASTGRLSKRKPSPSDSLQASRKILHGQPRGLAIVEAAKSGRSTSQIPNMREECPWDTFKKFYDCDLAGTVAVSVRRSSPTHIRVIRQFPSKDADEILQKFRCIHHENLIHAFECFRTADAFYAEVEHFPLTLEHIVACKAFPDQRQLCRGGKR